MANKDKHLNEKIDKAVLSDSRFDYREADWLALEKRLDQKKKKRGFLFYLPRIAAAIALLLISVGAFQFINSSNSSNKQSANTKKTNSSETGKENLFAEENKNSTNANNSVEEAEPNEFQLEQNINPVRNNGPQIEPREQNAIYATNPTRNQNTPTAKPTYDNNFTKPSINQYPTQQPNLANNQTDEQPKLPQPIVDDKETQQPINKEESQPSINKNDIPQQLKEEASELLIADNTSEEKLPEEADTPNKEDVVKLQNNTSKFSLGFGINPSTTATSDGTGKFGAGAGLRLNYKVTNRVDLATGAYYAVQNHQTPGSTYQDLDYYWTNYTNSVIPVSVEARNQVLEMPTLVDVQLTNKETNNVSISGGFLHSVTFNEKHEFDFGEQFTYPDSNDSWTVKEDAVRLFNHARISAAYETSLTPKTSLAIEPFANIPLKETEWGGLNLSNQGLALTLKFNGQPKE